MHNAKIAAIEKTAAIFFPLAASNRKETSMKIEIDIDIIKTTVRCRKSFDCLKNQNHCFKKVSSSMKGEFLWVHCDDKGCDYYLSFGNSTICNCPTRMAIYKKYAK